MNIVEAAIILFEFPAVKKIPFFPGSDSSFALPLLLPRWEKLWDEGEHSARP